MSAEYERSETFRGGLFQSSRFQYKGWDVRCENMTEWIWAWFACRGNVRLQIWDNGFSSLDDAQESACNFIDTLKEVQS